MKKILCFVVGLLYIPIMGVGYVTELGRVIISNYEFERDLKRRFKENSK